jgi:hypothetical protein
MLRRFSDFLMVSSFLIQIIVLAACVQKTGGFALYLPPMECKNSMRLAASRGGCQLHANCTRVAASRMQHE